MSKKMQKYLKDWIEWIKLERRLSKQTIKAYTSDVNFFSSILKSTKINQLIYLI